MATTVYDFKVDSDGDVAIENNDFVIAESNDQHIEDVLASVPGYYKESPLSGWNPYLRLNAKTSQQELRQSVITQLEFDGNKVISVNISINPEGAIVIKDIHAYRP